MPIKGMFEREQSGFMVNLRKVIGTVSLGLRGDKYPVQIDYFHIQSEDQQVTELARRLYGERPKRLPITFPSRNLDDVMDAWLEEWDARGLKMRSDGEYIIMRRTEDGKYERVHLPMPREHNMKPRVNIIFQIDGLPGYFRMSMTGYYSVNPFSKDIGCYLVYDESDRPVLVKPDFYIWRSEGKVEFTDKDGVRKQKKYYPVRLTERSAELPEMRQEVDDGQVVVEDILRAFPQRLNSLLEKYRRYRERQVNKLAADKYLQKEFGESAEEIKDIIPVLAGIGSDWDSFCTRARGDVMMAVVEVIKDIRSQYGDDVLMEVAIRLGGEDDEGAF